MADPRFVFDADEAGFERQVLERSDELPVVVDFWAAWCGPCRLLGPILEQLVEGPFAGRIALARVDVDSNPGLAARHHVQGIPAVQAFRRRRVVAEFVGALPEVQVRSFLERLLPTPADERFEAARARGQAGDAAGAEALYLEAVAADRLHAPAWLALGRLREERGDLARALDAFERVPGGGPEEAEAGQRAARIRLLLEAREIGDEAALAARLRGNPRDVEALYGLGLHHAARGEHRQALERLLAVVELDRAFRDDGGRKAMLLVFAAAGERSPLSDEFRSRLASVLY